MPKLGDFTVSVIDPVTETPFEEYKVSTNSKTTECYIASEAEKQFSVFIHFDDQRLGHSTICYATKIFVDGKRIQSRIFGRKGERPCTKIIRGADIGPEEFVPFVFGATCFTEEGQIDATQLSELGSITLKIYRVRNAKKLRQSGTKFFNIEELSQGTVNEKAKKVLLAHSVKFGRPAKMKTVRLCDVEYIDAESDPFLTFNFLYRSRSILEALDIVEPQPTQGERDSASADNSSDHEDEDNITNYSPEQIRQLKNELRELRELKRKVKREPDVATPTKLVDLTEPETKKRKVLIDLTM